MTKWPKKLPELSDRQIEIKNDFMYYILEEFPKIGGGIREKFSYSHPVKHTPKGGRVLDIGVGAGDALDYESLDELEYTAVELLPELAKKAHKNHPKAGVIIADSQGHLPFSDNTFDRVKALDVLEHLPDLPLALSEIYRVLKPNGVFCVAIPTEGLPNKLAHMLYTNRMFKKRYGTDCYWWLDSEHINRPWEVIEELEKYFTIKRKDFFPFVLPIRLINLALAMILFPKKNQ
ncbi:MAG: class I SAM-dependent methyltransferase [Candidatus Brocadiales bacterium]|nr:class I SAM-dependent methyltransferase [Candidatus Brocadiales bacterium]